ncbi:MAG TPA: response regulator [Myxococcaceae bacterium]|nr:response regulator [Myxococcaceae bacterium]
MRGGDAPILLVEDEPELGLVLQETIEEWDRRVLLVPSGSEAMRVLAEVPVGLLLLDWQLADMSGAELLDRLRSEKRPIPPVVLMTAGTRSALDVRWPEVVALLQKPFELVDLSRLLEKTLPRR